ncbi:hypothetical protein KC363_g9151 [Hortaea werneckii]|uniref:BZIP domain-containing protein n=1 Tax=Hortaea werneckii TaxID=91943 RepID=A0A3M7EUW8_HORWE|nr:hypothetical protein KC361_g9494 [Hortaea werneckii]KAI6878507.1 hypothetical protein KC325_g8551 [Hortaea werneckii]KAI6986416.1 hypothetical protein KC359_g8760 [Hortaea werneckii]KAI7140684.1 hypothetical protein KC344_g8546 [Hortaea werneckii]KAI7166416.1 hypothetical protein KC360_g9164 [Hortaea werneckii]
MSGFTGGRRAPNVSQYLADLNTIPGPQDLSGQQNDFGGLGDDLDFLTNTEFFDFDNFNNVDFSQPAPADLSQPQQPVVAPQQQQQQQQPQQKPQNNGAGMNGAQYQFGEFQTYQIPPNNGLSQPQPNGLQGPFPQQTPTFSPSQPMTGDKRKASAAGVSSPADFEENARVAAEEDKRRRNTAASARFRVKKKQREAELEKRAKEMTDKVQQLEGRVQQLETENKWLKGLITERGSAGGESTTAAEKGSEGRKEAEERSTEQRTEGVGTEQAESEQVTV